MYYTILPSFFFELLLFPFIIFLCVSICLSLFSIFYLFIFILNFSGIRIAGIFHHLQRKNYSFFCIQRSKTQLWYLFEFCHPHRRPKPIHTIFLYLQNQNSIFSKSKWSKIEWAIENNFAYKVSRKANNC